MNTAEKTYKVDWLSGISGDRKAVQERMFRLVESVTEQMAKDKSLSKALSLSDAELAQVIFEKQMARDALIPERELRVMRSINDGTRKFVSRLQQLGGTVKAGEIASLLETTRQTINNRLKQGKLLAVRFGTDNLFPVFQLDGTKMVDGFEDILALLGDSMSPVTKVSFFTGMYYFENPELNVIDAMKSPNAEQYMHEIKHQAALFGRHIAK